MSKYQDLAKSLRNAIESGEYETGSRLPTTPELCSIYGVSNTTVKKALDELEDLGLIARRRGSGIYVKSIASLRKSHRDNVSTSGPMSGLTAEYAETDTVITSEVHEFCIEHPTPEVADALDLRVEEFVYRICRTRLVDGKPKNVEYTYMPINLVPGLLEEHLHGSIYRYLEEDLGFKISSAHRVLRAVMPSDEECAWLRIGPDQPLFEVHQVAYLDDGTPFEYSTTHHAGDYKFYVVSTH